MSVKNIPIFINSFNRATVLSELVTWLLDHGYTEIVIIDNGSEYPVLLDYYKKIRPRIKGIARLGRNLGHLALWRSGLLNHMGWRGPYVYTDPDIIPTEDCPDNVVEYLLHLLDKYPTAMKTGLGLRIDDLPDHYCHKNTVIEWERQFWNTEIEHGVYAAAIDTTFAAYRANVSWTVDILEKAKLSALRTGTPYTARHMDWYLDLSNPSEEQRFYQNHAASNVTTWSKAQPSDSMHNVLRLLKTGIRINKVNHKAAKPGT